MKNVKKSHNWYGVTLALLWACLLGMSQTATAVTVGQVAPLTELPSIKGDAELRLSHYRGKVVLVDFWASWCPPCRKSLPLFDDLRRTIGADSFDVFAINVDEEPSDGIKFYNQLKVEYSSGLDPLGKMAEAWAVQGMPTSYLVDKKGVVRLIHTGFKEKDIAHLKEKIEWLLSEGE